MSDLWPRLPLQAAIELFAAIEAGPVPTPATAHPSQVYAQVGGRVPARQITTMHDLLAGAAREHGYPHALPSDPVSFDRAATPLIRETMDLSWAEAACGEVWSFVALVALPDLTDWRWRGQRSRNRERWVGADLQRHTWGRLWWRAVAFQDDPGLLERLSESDLNQLLERRIIGGNPRLLTAVSRALIAATPSGQPLDRELIRDATKRLRRALAFVDDISLDDSKLDDLATRVVGQARQALDTGG